MKSLHGSLISTAFSGLGKAFALSIFQKVLTFLFNQAILQLVEPQVFGFYSVQLSGILHSSILFLSREGLRLAALRVNIYKHSSDSFETSAEQKKRNAVQLLVNVAWSAILLSFVYAGVLGFLLLYLESGHFTKTSNFPWRQYKWGVIMFCLSGWFESFSEPFYLLSQNGLLFDIRVKTEAFSSFIRILLTLAFVSSRSVYVAGIYAFGWASIAYSISLFLIYTTFFARIIHTGNEFIYSWSQLLPRRITYKQVSENESTEHKRLINLCISFTLQSWFKHFLSEGDKITMYLANDFLEQGLYGVVSNYGSLAARLLFQHVEEFCRIVICKLLLDTEKENKRELAERSKLKAYTFFSAVTKLMFFIGLCFMNFAPRYTHLLKIILLGSSEKWARVWAAALPLLL
jgi:oligosaccharide translocation protein RFT1